MANSRLKASMPSPMYFKWAKSRKSNMVTPGSLEILSMFSSKFLQALPHCTTGKFKITEAILRVGTDAFPEPLENFLQGLELLFQVTSLFLAGLCIMYQIEEGSTPVNRESGRSNQAGSRTLGFCHRGQRQCSATNLKYEKEISKKVLEDRILL